MKNFLVTLTAVAALALPVLQADTIGTELAIHIDGSIYNSIEGDSIDDISTAPINAVDASGFNFGTGIGSVKVRVNGGAAPAFYNLGAFFDLEITNGLGTDGFSDEAISASNPGMKPANLGYEGDEPGYSFGDIYTNFAAGVLDDSIAPEVSGGNFEDASVALMYNVYLEATWYAVATFTASKNQPAGGFYLTQSDDDLAEKVYYSAQITIVPEPATVSLLGLGLLGAAFAARKRFIR